MNISNQIIKSSQRIVMLVAVVILMTPVSYAAPLDMADAPLFLVTNVPPNILLTIDDSGSMAWGYAPDGISGTGGEPEYHSAYFNPIYYDPDVTYSPPVDVNGLALTTSFTSAWNDGFDHSLGSTNLATSFRHRHEYYMDGSRSTAYAWLFGARRAFYYRYDDTRTNCDTTAKHWANQRPTDNDCYEFVQLPTDAAQEQNFANWYSFYSNRSLATASAASLAFSQISGTTRVGFQLLGNNGCGGFMASCDGPYDGTRVDSRLRKFTGTHRAGLYTFLSRLPTNSGTPLRRSMERAGLYYQTDDPYWFEPGSTQNPLLACRQNYHIMMTDGIWNGWDPVTAAIGNYDDSSHTLPDGTNYTGNLPPYEEPTTRTLADVALYFWARDLNTSAGLGSSDALKYMPVSLNETYVYGANSNILTPYWNPKNDPANWQHMVNFMVAMGLSTSLITDPIQWQGETYTSESITGHGYRPLASGNTSWPNPGGGTANIYDLWHAALNSRGQFFSADSPDDMVHAFRTIIDRIQSRQGTASNLSFNAGTVSSNTQFYQSLFDSSGWKGHLLALPLSDGSSNLTCTIEPRGGICPTLWDAGGVLTGGTYKDPQDPSRTLAGGTAINWDTERVVITHNGSAGVPFRWSSLSATQKSLLQDGGSVGRGEATVDFLRGSRTCEYGSTGTCGYDINNDSTANDTDKVFRERLSVLGDIVNSSPSFIGNPVHPYRTGSDSEWVDELTSVIGPETDYASFAGPGPAGVGERLNVVYVGANDGMLHAFRAGRITDTNGDSVIDDNDTPDNSLNDGREVLSYIPSKVYENLPLLTKQNYEVDNLHKFFVDGELEVVDAFLGGSGGAWRSMLVSGMGNGAQGIFALDVTNPDTFSEADAANIAMWEFSDSDDVDLGNTLGQPNTIRMHNTRWGVIVGNGYNTSKADGHVSVTGHAVLYILNAEDGSILRKLDTGVGPADDPTGAGRPNGLGSVTPIDLDIDDITDYVYAPDLYGNIWRFDLTDPDPAKWVVSYGSTPCASDGSQKCTPLFRAFDTSSPTNKAQPTTTKIVADWHPAGNGFGVMVYFGTGKYFENTDNSADLTTFQTIYGVRDISFPAFYPNFGTLSIPPLPANGWELRRADLVQQTIDYEGLDATSGETIRVLSANNVDWANKWGWYLDLKAGNSTLDAGGHIVKATTWVNNGELVAADPLIVGDSLIVPTLIPNDDSCSTGGSGWIMSLNKATGGKPPIDVFRRKYDGEPVAGIYYGEAPPGTPAFISGQIYTPLGQGEVAQTVYDTNLEGRKNWSTLR